MASSEDTQRGAGWRSRWKRRLLIGAAAIVTIAMAWVIAHKVPRAIPPPLYGNADLPAPPPPSDNGWLAIAGPDATVRSVSVPQDLTNLLPSGDPDLVLDRARARRAALGGFLSGRDAVVGLQALERAASMPRFADACPAQVDANCKLFPLLSLHRLGLLEALRRGVDGDWSPALSLSARLVRADIDAATTSRMLIAHAISMTNLRQGLEMVSALLDGRARAAAPLDAAATESLRALDGALEKLDATPTGTLSAHRAVVSEYLMIRGVIEQVASGQGVGDGEFQGVGSRLLFDRAATHEEVNRRFSAIAAFAAAPATEPPAMPIMHHRPFWWAYNPVGKMVLDAIALDWAPHVRKLDADRARIEAMKTKVRSSLAAALRPAP